MKNILLTGAYGFLGKVIASHLRLLNFGLKTIGKRPEDDFWLDLSTNDAPSINGSFDTVIHCAGKAHSVPKTEKEKQEFFDINVKGTQNLLRGLEASPVLPRSFVLISTIAVYGKETGTLIDEESLLLAKDPYGLSKIQAEQLIQEWCLKMNIICTILRLPLIAGPNPPGNLKAMINAIFKGFYFDIAGGKARKSIVLAEDVAEIIPEVTGVGGIYNLTDGFHPSFSALSESIASQLGKRRPMNISVRLATLMAKIGDLVGKKAPINSDKLRKITSDLTFDDAKARSVLGWQPRSVIRYFKIK